MRKQKPRNDKEEKSGENKLHKRTGHGIDRFKLFMPEKKGQKKRAGEFPGPF
jgi:hypothetical protein